jgi:hypothetical protein
MSITWNPTNQQFAESDTIFGPVDFNAELSITTPSNGGFYMGNPLGTLPTLSGTASGKFLTGHRPINNTAYNFWQIPMAGLLAADEWLVEFWVNSDNAWNTIDANLVAFGDPNFSFYFALECAGGTMSIRYTNNQVRPPVVKGPSFVMSGANWVAGNWVSVAVGYKASAFSMWINGAVQTLSGSNTGVTPAYIASSADSGGHNFNMLCKNGAIPVSTVTLSDLRISRYVRPLNTPFTIPSDAGGPIATIGAATGQSFRKELVGTEGGLKTVALSLPFTNTVGSIKFDKPLGPTPIKAGAPDATHPSAGHSGLWSYDWQVVDRTGDRAVQQMGVLDMYIQLEGNPQVLGGTSPPLGGTALTTNVTGQWFLDPSVPNDLTKYSQLLSDLLYHMIVEKGWHVVGITAPTNEPDLGSGAWTGTELQLHQTFAAASATVKAFDPNIKVGALELSDVASFSWLTNLLNYCVANSVAIDFLATHDYSGDVGYLFNTRRIIDNCCVAAGMPTGLPFLVGEWGWTSACWPGGQRPFSGPGENYQMNDWSAAMMAEGFIWGTKLNESALNLLTLCIFETIGQGGDGGGSTYTGLVNTNAGNGGLHQYSNMCMYQMFMKMGTEMRSVSYPGWPGVSIMATRDTSTNHMTVVLAFRRFRRNATAPVRLALGAAYANRTATAYLMDSGHSNYKDAGASHEFLETTTPVVFDSSGNASVTLTGRSVLLLDVPPAITMSFAGGVQPGASEQRYLALFGNYAFMTQVGGRFYVIDISNPRNPVLVKTINDARLQSTWGVTLSNDGQYAFVCVSGNGINQIVTIDISVPTNASIVSTYTNAAFGPLLNGCVNGTTLCVVDTLAPGQTNQFSVYAIDASTPTALNLSGSITHVTNFNGSGSACRVIDANHILTNSIAVVNTSIPSALSVTGHYSGNYTSQNIVVAGTTAYSVFGPDLKAWNIANLAAPALLGTVTDSTNLNPGLGIDYSNGKVYYYCATDPRENRNVGSFNPISNNPGVTTPGHTIGSLL